MNKGGEGEMLKSEIQELNREREGKKIQEEIKWDEIELSKESGAQRQNDMRNEDYISWQALIALVQVKT